PATLRSTTGLTKTSTPCSSFLSSYPRAFVSKSTRTTTRSAATGKRPSRNSATPTTRLPTKSFVPPKEELMNTPMEPGQNPDDYFNRRGLNVMALEQRNYTMRQRYTTATRSMNQPANAAREKRKGKGKGRGRSPGAKTVNRTHGAARPGSVPGSKNNQ
ncbi:unnamed protein product, partial [Ascophyllum nodosum]